MQQISLVRINFPAGIISPGFLLELMEIASAVRIAHVRFGSRQQLLMDVPRKHFDEFVALCSERRVRFFTKKDTGENIISSYVAAGIFISDSWLSEGVYKDIFDLFDYLPQLKVNINDNTQTFTPLFTGNINWIASPHIHFWYLYVRFPNSNAIFRWPELVYTNNICILSKQIERLILDEGIQDGHLLVSLLKSGLTYISKAIEKDLVLPRFHLPYYEGFNQCGTGYWLGIYRRDELFSVAFLKDLCTICLQTKISELYATTWKSIIIKGIEKGQRLHWDYVLGKYRINVRHAANELNWLVEDDCEDGLILKRHIIRYFDKEDVRTYGLCFSIKIKSRSGIFGSVIIRREEVKNPHRLKSLERFSILYTAGFNPNSDELVLFRDKVEKEFLGLYLVSLCKQFYETESTKNEWKPHAAGPLSSEGSREEKEVYCCPDCLTVYNEEVGDPDLLIPAGTSFSKLPKDYCCPLCETSKTDFAPVQKIMSPSGA
jgi:rubredoxin